jgi:hypothetical protein
MPNFEDTTPKAPRPDVRLFRLLIDQYDQALDMREADTAHTFLRTLGLAIKHELGEEQKQPFNASFTISGKDVLLAFKRGMETDNRFRSVTSIVRNGDTIGELSEGQFESGPKALEPTIPASALKQFDEVVAGLRQAAEVLSTRSRTVSVTPTGGLLFSPALSLAERMGLDLGTTTKSQWDRLQAFAKGNVVEPCCGPSLETLTEVLSAKPPQLGVGDLVFEFGGFEGFDGSTYIVQAIQQEQVRIKPVQDIVHHKGNENEKVVKQTKLGLLRKAGDYPPLKIAPIPPKRDRTNTNRAEPG